jgi:hypothetical protein
MQQLGLNFKPKQQSEQTNASVELLHSLWLSLRASWFPERNDLDSYIVTWSRRSQKRTLASCSIHRKKVVVARELNRPEYTALLSPLLYHEMCHAVLGFEQAPNSNRRSWHGKRFKALEQKNPEIKTLDRWISEGGWTHAVRSDRAKRSHAKRKKILAWFLGQ